MAHERCTTAAANLPVKSLWELCAAADESSGAVLHARQGSVALKDLKNASILGGMLGTLRGRCVLLATHDQLPTALALLELDGVARRMVLCTPDLSAQQLTAVAAASEADAILVDAQHASTAPASLQTFLAAERPVAEGLQRRSTGSTEWVLLTSGTTGQPKLVVHDVESLAGALPRHSTSAQRMVWSTFYDMRRYGGLQIYMRAVLSGSALVLSCAGEPAKEFLSRAQAARVTHISGTPSHWRRALMSGDARLIDPEYVRLSGEVADQTVLDTLQAAYPRARIAHAFASTEAGVAFDVNDGLAGFPRQLIEQPTQSGGIDMKVQDGTLWIRSKRTASRYLNAAAKIGGDDGYVDTGDLVELQGERYHFRGRKGGVINVGGLKVYPEEVESVLNADPRVRLSRVMARRNSITGALIIAEVVLADPQGSHPADSIKDDLLQACRRELAAHKVPAMMRFVPSLELTAAGKLVRPDA
jgi:acyl-coenzyme A synthetase/AMP-(fatty) acid ligase